MAAVSRKWRKLLSLLPGYDPFRDAGEAWFDEEAAQVALDFFPECLTHVEGDLAGKPFVLEPWQQAFVANLQGWKQRDEKGRTVRRYREAFLKVPRKNGKSPLVAGLAVEITFTEDERGQQNYIAAGEREQAGKLFRHAKGMVEAEPELARRCRIYGGKAEAGQSRSIVKPDSSFLRVISADASGEHGGNTHLGIIDELHVQPDRELYDVLRTSTASLNRKQPLIITVTAADYVRESICNEVDDYASKVREGIIRDPRFLPAIWEAGPSDDWRKEATWRKANPNLGVSVSLEYLRAECKKAEENPAYENTFRRLHLNQKVETAVRAMPMDRWDAAPSRRSDEQLAGQVCFGGLDLASTIDIAAFVLAFPDGQGDDRPVDLLCFFWVPEENAALRERRDRVPYQTWARQRLIRTTPGNVIDYDFIRRDVLELAGRYDIRKVGADPWNARQLVIQLRGDGIDVEEFRQGYTSMTAPTKEFLRLVTAGRLRHGGHPVLRWMASNLSTEQDAAGNLKPSKKKSSEKIDGIVAGIMAIGEASGDAGGTPTITVI